MEVGVRKGAWSSEEDILLRDCIHKYGEGKWHLVPVRAGLNRCRKSCRLRWLNYLRPDIKRGHFGNDEVDLIVRLHKLLGNRWSLIAGRLPGRTANDVKNFWNTHINSKKPPSAGETDRGKTITITRSNIARPRPRTFSNSQTPAWSTQLTTSSSSAPLIKHQRGEDPSTKTQQLPFSSSAPLSVENVDDRTNSYQAGEDALLPEDLDECLRWWGDLLHTTENGQEMTPFSFPNGSSSTANNDGRLCGSSSLLGVDLGFEQL